jgi:hypothetical protein
MENEIIIPEEIRKDVANISEMAKNIQIKTHADRTAISQMLVESKVRQKKIDDLLDDSIKKAHDAHSSLCAVKNGLKAPYIAFEKAAKAANKIWDDKIEAERAAEEARLNAIEQERVRRENAKLAAEAAEQRRKEAEARARAEESRKQAENASKAERKRLLKEANKAELQAAAAQAKAEIKTETAAANIPNAIEVKAPEKQAGESYRETWTWKVTDISKVPDNYKILNETMLNKFAVATKGAVPVPGIEFYNDRQLAVRVAKYPPITNQESF